MTRDMTMMMAEPASIIGGWLNAISSVMPVSYTHLDVYKRQKGIYPVQAPPYDTAFVFIENMFSDESVPAWAMKVVLEEEQIMEYGSKPKDTGEQDLGDHNL